MNTHKLDSKEYDLMLEELSADLYDYFCKLQESSKIYFDPFFESNEKLKRKKASNE